jgi:hypothetical protein
VTGQQHAQPTVTSSHLQSGSTCDLAIAKVMQELQLSMPARTTILKLLHDPAWKSGYLHGEVRLSGRSLSWLQPASLPRGEKDYMGSGRDGLKCDRLSWLAAPNDAAGYDVVPLECITCRQVLVPAWGQKSCDFHASALLEHLTDTPQPDIV